MATISMPIRRVVAFAAGVVHGVVIVAAGDVYVADSGSNRALTFAPGASAPAGLQFTGLDEPGDVAVDTTGSVYLLDELNFRVLKLPAH